VKADGDYQTTSDAESVPVEARKRVRIIHADHPSSPETVWVADLSISSETLSATELSRTEWESVGAKERSARVEAARPKNEELPASSALSSVSATLYGASWCHACKSAEAYLRSKGVALVKKDIEEDPTAQAEMSAKLRRAGQGGSSIPVIDIAGTVMVGFSEGAINAALNRALKK
jgi:glutaredoxin